MKKIKLSFNSNISSLKLFAVAVCTAPFAYAEETSAIADWWNGERLFGEWGGARNSMEEAGVEFFGSYEQDYAGNTSGGMKQGATNSGSIEFGFRLDFEKLIGWEDTTFLIRAVDRNGRDLSSKYIGNFFPVQQDFGTETLMLQSVALEKRFFDRSLSVKLGRVAMGDDFATSPLYGLYMNNAIDGTPKNLTTTVAFSCYPGSVWGGRVLYQDPDSEWYGKFGVYQANDRIYDGDDHGLNFDIRSNDGISLISEFGWTPTFNKKQTTDATGKTVESGLPGHYWIGAYGSFWDLPKFNGRGEESFSYAIYIHADQMIYNAEEGTEKGLTIWGLANIAPVKSVQVMPWQVSAGFAYTGAIPGRDQDKIIFGTSYGDFSNDYAKQQELATGQKPNGEMILELAYSAQINKFTKLQPDIQYIIHPAGLSSISNALVLGIRLNVTF